MTDATQRLPDSRISVWHDEPAEATAMPRWARPLERLSEVLKSVRQPRHVAAATVERSSGEMTTQPAGGRGQALREAHRSLRLHLHRHPALRRLLPHLHYIEEALARQGSAALIDLPPWLLQRALQQLARLPWDEHPEPSLHPLLTLRQRLTEAIELHGLHAAVRRSRSSEGSVDDALDSRSAGVEPLGRRSAGFELDALPREQTGEAANSARRRR
jgi:hypothetical protein